MKRSKKEINIIKKRKSDAEFYCCRSKPDGVYRKNKPLGCSRPQCYICHSDKYPKRKPTQAEREAQQKLGE